MKRTVTLCAILLAGLVAAPASAALQLRITDGVTTETFTDVDVDGRVVSDFRQIGDFSVFGLGVSKPDLGSAVHPVLDSLGLVINSPQGVSGKVSILISDDGFTGLTSGFLASIGGTTQGTVEYNTYLDTANTLFGTGTQITASGPIHGNLGAFADTQMSTSGADSGPYSITLEVIVTHAEGDTNTSFNAELRPNPEPASVAVWSMLALAGLAVSWRNRRKGQVS